MMLMIHVGSGDLVSGEIDDTKKEANLIKHVSRLSPLPVPLLPVPISSFSSVIHMICDL
jgi:hypothetical protein